ncbi:MAG: hypothetical protein HC844_17625 [Tabrizicola sp.]|nr:hypothetical protein [Tabrizicola sp.]
MKQFILAIPATALLAAVALAQTDTGTDAATESDAGGMMYGSTWSTSVGTTFFEDGTPGTLRSAEDISTGWQSLPQEDRDMVLADCQTFMAAHGGEASTDGAMTEGATSGEGADAATGTEATGTESSGAATEAATGTGTTTEPATGSATAPESGSADPDAVAPAGYDMAEMKMLCEVAQGL